MQHVAGEEAQEVMGPVGCGSEIGGHGGLKQGKITLAIMWGTGLEAEGCSREAVLQRQEVVSGPAAGVMREGQTGMCSG